jgi:hypothetical protein
MKPAPQFPPLRSAVIFEHTRRMLAESAWCVRKFAMRVTEEYMAAVAPEARQVPFRYGVTGEDLYRAEKHNGQIANRYLDGVLKNFPADLEDAWVRALPSPYREDLEADLSSRRGLLAVKRMQPGQQSEAVGLSELAKEFGELIEALAPALADSRITSADLPYARRILRESDELIAAVLGVRRQLTELLPEGSPT